MTILGSSLTPQYRFNPRLGSTGRYIDRRGRAVSAETVTREMERVIAGTKREMQDISRQLQRGEISAQEWYDGMRGRMKTIHTLDAAIAKGGWQQMTQADWGAVGAVTKRQYQYLNNFVEEILSGKQALDGRFLVRAGMYANAARRTGEDLKRREAAGRGYDLERRVLGPTEHCRDCLEYAGRGWQPVGSLPPIGDSICKVNCRCVFEFARLEDGEIVPVK